MGSLTIRFRLMLPCALIALAIVAASSSADTVFLQSGTGKPVPLEQVKVEGVQDQNIRFTTAAGVSNTKPLDHVPEIHIDGESVFSAAEAEFAKSDWAEAADKYRWVIDHNSPDWIRLRSATRLAETAERTGKADDAVIAFVARTKLLPATDPNHAPKPEAIPPAQLDSAIATLNQAVTDPKLGKERKVLLLKYLIDLHGFAAVVDSEQLKRLAPPPPPPPKPPEPRHPAPTPALPPTTEPPRVQLEKAIESARKARDAKMGSAAQEFTTAAADAFRRLNERRKTEFEIAVTSFDVRIKEITKTGDLDKALAVRAEKEKYIAQAEREDAELAQEWNSLLKSAGATSPSTIPAEGEKSQLERFLSGTKWAWGRDEVVEFRGDGKVGEAYWASVGHVTEWKVVDRRTVILLMVKGGTFNRCAVLTFHEDLSKYDAINFDGSALPTNSRAPAGVAEPPPQSGANPTSEPFAERADAASAHATPWDAPSFVPGKAIWPARPGGYALASTIRIGNIPNNHGGTWSAGDVVAEPGFILVGGVITASGGSINFQGTPDNPVILKGVRIECEYTASIKAENTIFQGCIFWKAGAWYWNSGYSAKFELKGCVLDRCAFSSLARMDYGIKFEGCDFRECQLPERHWGFQNSERPSDDGAALARAEWSEIKDCGFYKCKVAPSAIWMTQRCDFSDCEVTNRDDFASKTDLPVEVGVSPAGAAFIDELVKNTSHSGSGTVRYVRKAAPGNWASRSPVWAWINRSRDPSSETKGPTALFDVPK